MPLTGDPSKDIPELVHHGKRKRSLKQIIAIAMAERRRRGRVKKEASAFGIVIKSMPWEESEHPRGQPENAGEFASSDSGGTAVAERPKSGYRGHHKDWSEESYYHGSNDDIDSFSNVTKRGISFTDNPYHSSEFGKNLYETKLAISNPLDLTHLGSGAGEESEDGDERVSTKQIREALAEYGIKVQFPRERKGWTSDLLRPVMENIIKQAEAKGFDALTIMDFKEFEAVEIVVFDPKNIKLVDKVRKSIRIWRIRPFRLVLKSHLWEESKHPRDESGKFSPADHPFTHWYDQTGRTAKEKPQAVHDSEAEALRAVLSKMSPDNLKALAAHNGHFHSPRDSAKKIIDALLERAHDRRGASIRRTLIGRPTPPIEGKSISDLVPKSLSWEESATGQHLARGHDEPVANNVSESPTELTIAHGNSQHAMTRAEVENESRDRKRKWTEVERGPLGRLKWIGSKPNGVGMSPATDLGKWREFATEIGKHGVSEIVSTLEPTVHHRIPPEDGGETKAAIRYRARQSVDEIRGGRGHEADVPDSHYARQLVHEYLRQGNGIDDLHTLHLILTDVFNRHRWTPKAFAGGIKRHRWDAVTKGVASNFTGAVFGRYYISGKEVDKSTYDAQRGKDPRRNTALDEFMEMGNDLKDKPAPAPVPADARHNTALDEFMAMGNEPPAKSPPALPAKTTGSKPPPLPIERVKSRVRDYLKLAGKVPAQTKKHVQAFVKQKYQSLAGRYGHHGAAAILTAAVLLMPVPVPGTSLLPVAFAEAMVQLKRMLSKGYEGELDEETIQREAKALVAELMKQNGGDGEEKRNPFDVSFSTPQSPAR